ncbi:acyl-CoA dehydrogenase [Sphingomonas montanisoli]|uniref:acyl-CoA dehydrogenase n=1 Tax=Sphingomonas montanisoli TaxID=2606412 RepID=UPI0015E18341|nr:acyl-CoA dehydrogenase [Sphingomonas montanisoli]
MDADMDLGLPEESLALEDMFKRLFETESSPAHVRAAEADHHGFDRALWRTLAELGVPLMRVPAARGGSELGLLDATILMEEAGRRLASVPIAEALIAASLIARSTATEADAWLEAIGSGDKFASIALAPIGIGAQMVAGAAVADAVVALDGERLFLCPQATRPQALQMVADNATAWFEPQGERVLLLEGAAAVAAFHAAVEEWKLLSAAALIGLSEQALTMAAEYASERTAFGQVIGTFQGLSHPLADCVVDVDGARMFLRWIFTALAHGDPVEAGAGIDQLWWFVNKAATRTVAHSLHVFGGYGLSNEYDIQLYHRRAKSLGLMLGDPELALERAGRRLYLGEPAFLPNPGAVTLDFAPSADARALADETRAKFEALLTPELRAKAHHSFEGHDWGVSKAMGEAGLLFPAWPKRWGGREASAEAARAALDVWETMPWTINPQGTSNLVGQIIQAFGTDQLKEEVLPRLGRGEITAALGYTEPSGGSDVFGAKTRAERDGDGWIINGQKMFTSGAEWASYALLITRTDPDLPKHKGTTLFLVPLDGEGVEIHPIFTFMDERTNATFYSDVRIADHYRLGDVNGGVKVLAAALQMEQGGTSYYHNQRNMAEKAIAWARGAMRGGRPAIEDNRVLARIARTHANARIGESLGARTAWVASRKLPDHAYGPAAKIFITETFITDSADLMDLAAPASLVRGREGLGVIEESYRHSTATTIYAGTSEVLRSMVGERRLGLPRSRA